MVDRNGYEKIHRIRTNMTENAEDTVSTASFGNFMTVWASKLILAVRFVLLTFDESKATKAENPGSSIFVDFVDFSHNVSTAVFRGKTRGLNIQQVICYR